MAVQTSMPAWSVRAICQLRVHREWRCSAPARFAVIEHGADIGARFKAGHMDAPRRAEEGSSRRQLWPPGDFAPSPAINTDQKVHIMAAESSPLRAFSDSNPLPRREIRVVWDRLYSSPSRSSAA